MFTNSLRTALCALALSLPVAQAQARRGEETEVLPKQEELVGPWFTGTLLSSSASVVPLGYINLEPYVFVSDTFGQYDHNWHTHSVPDFITATPLIYFQIGVTDWMDFEIVPAGTFQHTRGKSSTKFEDLLTAFDFQLVSSSPDNYFPDIKLVLREIFPTGKYQHLSPHKHNTDSAGTGSYDTGFGLAIGRIFHLGGVHYLNARANLFCDVFTKVHVEGFNTYGGGFGTRGVVRPGTIYTGILGFELSLTQNWVFALDAAAFFGNKTTFHGRKGFTAPGEPADVGFPSFTEIDFAPAIEYNFSESLGIIAGAWFSAFGRNSGEFVAGVIAINWYANIIPSKKTSLGNKGGTSGGHAGPGGAGL